MHKTLPESRALAEGILAELFVEGAPHRDLIDGGLRVGLFPTAVSLTEVVRAAAKLAGGAGDSLLIGAQNMHFEPEGAFTGEISASMIKSAGGNAVIVGHSERRHVFGEDDETAGKKVGRAVEAGLVPILCVGETIGERDSGETEDVVKRQLESGLAALRQEAELARVVIAYEPVWAIGTGRTATPEQAQQVHELVRSELGRKFEEIGSSRELSRESHILYGGSVKPGNAADLLAEKDIDGALVGGASLEADSFLGICAAARRS